MESADRAGMPVQPAYAVATAAFKLCVPYSALPLREEIVDTLIESILKLERFDDVVPVLLMHLTPLHAETYAEADAQA
jgi:hypothetical protein